MGGAVSLGRLRCVAAPSSIGLVTLAAAKLKAVHACARFLVLSRFPFTDVSVHVIGSAARCNSAATSVMAGPAGGVPAVERPAGGDATLEKLSDPAAAKAQLGCAAPALELLLKLIVEEDSSQKRHQLGEVLGEFLREEGSVLSSLRNQNKRLLKRTKPPPLGGPPSRRSGYVAHDKYVTAHERCVTDDGYATDDGCATDDGRNVEDEDPIPMKFRDEDDLIEATERYRDIVYVRNMWEAYVSRDSWKLPYAMELYRDLSAWDKPHQLLLYFERCEIPEIQSAQMSRREGWTNFLRQTPTLRSALEHHAKWGPDLDKQVHEILVMWVVADEGEKLWPIRKTHEKSCRQKFKSDNHCHFNIGLFSSQQVAALQCLGEYQRFLYVAVDEIEKGSPDSFLGRAVGVLPRSRAQPEFPVPNHGNL